MTKTTIEMRNFFSDTVETISPETAAKMNLKTLKKIPLDVDKVLNLIYITQRPEWISRNSADLFEQENGLVQDSKTGKLTELGTLAIQNSIAQLEFQKAIETRLKIILDSEKEHIAEIDKMVTHLQAEGFNVYKNAAEVLKIALQYIEETKIYTQRSHGAYTRSGLHRPTWDILSGRVNTSNDYNISEYQQEENEGSPLKSLSNKDALIFLKLFKERTLLHAAEIEKNKLTKELLIKAQAMGLKK
jgi:hypothetical protein